MTTVTAKELRQNLSAYLDRMEAGEEIAVIRHSEIIGKLRPAKKEPKSNGPAIAAFIRDYRKRLQASRTKPVADPHKSTKQLYHEALDEKYDLK